ncbi:MULTISPECIES: NAD(P)/FAD-dependent oxidoreductase [Chitinophagaceae]
MDLKSNEPFWLIKNGLFETYPSLRKDTECDILIVGSGITGSLIAHQCISDGYNTVLIDKREICNGSTSATTSMLQYEIDIPLYQLTEKIGEEGARACYKACSEAIDKLGETASLVKSDAGFRKKKSLYFAARKKDVPWLKKEFEARQEAGLTVSWMEPKEILHRYGLSENYGGILSTQAGSVDAFKLAHEILRYNTNKGLYVFDKTELVHVKHKADHNVCLVSSGATIKTKKIIYCTGYESTNMIKEKFVHLLSTFAVISEVNEPLYKKFNDILFWNTNNPYLYMRTSEDGRFLIGGEDEEFRDPLKRDALLERKENKLTKAFQNAFPKVEFIPDFAWAGTFGSTKDGLPYIGKHKKFANSYFVLGFGGNGITFSVTGMDMVAAWLKGKEHPLARYFAFGR